MCEREWVNINTYKKFECVVVKKTASQFKLGLKTCENIRVIFFVTTQSKFWGFLFFVVWDNGYKHWTHKKHLH